MVHIERNGKIRKILLTDRMVFIDVRRFRKQTALLFSGPLNTERKYRPAGKHRPGGQYVLIRLHKVMHWLLSIFLDSAFHSKDKWLERN
jgi:hypothetical protein